MKFLVLVPMLLASASLIAAPITSHSSSHDWAKASAAERSEYATYVIKNLDGKYQTDTLISCITKSFADSRNQVFKISKIAGGCHTNLSVK